MSYEHAVEMVDRLRGELKSPTEVAQAISKEALDKGTLDNVTCIVVYLVPPKAAPKKPSSTMDVYEFLRTEHDTQREEIDKQNKEKFGYIQQLFDLPNDEKILDGKKRGEEERESSIAEQVAYPFPFVFHAELTCSLEKKMLHQGTLYLTSSYMCFEGKKKSNVRIDFFFLFFCFSHHLHSIYCIAF
jgi:hypothetical protein